MTKGKSVRSKKAPTIRKNGGKSNHKEKITDNDEHQSGGFHESEGSNSILVHSTYSDVQQEDTDNAQCTEAEKQNDPVQLPDNHLTEEETMCNESITITSDPSDTFDEGDLVTLTVETEIQAVTHCWKRTKGPAAHIMPVNDNDLSRQIIIPEFETHEKALEFALRLEDTVGEAHEKRITLSPECHTAIGFIALVELKQNNNIWFCLVHKNHSATAKRWVEVNGNRAWFRVDETLPGAGEMFLWAQHFRLPVRVRYIPLDDHQLIPEDSFLAKRIRILRDDGQYQ